MSQKQGSSKRQRAAFHAGRARGSDIKTGHKHSKHPLDDQQKILVGKGMLTNRPSVGGPRFQIAQPSKPGTLDMKQAMINKELGYW